MRLWIKDFDILPKQQYICGIELKINREKSTKLTSNYLLSKPEKYHLCAIKPFSMDLENNKIKKLWKKEREKMLFNKRKHRHLHH